MRHPGLGCYVGCPIYKQVVGCLIQTETLPTNRPRPSLSPIGLTTDKRLRWGWISRQRLTHSRLATRIAVMRSTCGKRRARLLHTCGTIFTIGTGEWSEANHTKSLIHNLWGLSTFFSATKGSTALI